MRIERTKNATRNVGAGVVLKLFNILLPFLFRTILIRVFGAEYLGLNGLFASVLQVLNLAELGVGSAMVFSMYLPIIEDECEKICALLSLYRTYYRLIGLIILVGGLFLTPFIPELISGSVPEDINIYVLYTMHLSSTVLSYWLFAYKNSLLTAHQRSDVISYVTLGVQSAQYVIQTVVVFLYKNYYLYVLVTIFAQILLNVVTAIAAQNMYPQYIPKGKLEREQIKEINQRIKDLFTSKVGEVIVNSADTIVISAFLGLVMLAVYNNYYYILSSVMGFVVILFTSCTAGVGNSLLTETKQKNMEDMNAFVMLVSWISTFCAACFLCLYQPFMRIWMGDSMLLPYGCVICLAIYFYVRMLNQVFVLYKDAAGMWHEDRFRPLCTALSNLVLNLMMVRFVGIYGILLSTVLSTVCIGSPWLIHNLYSVVFKDSPMQFIRKILRHIAISSAICIFCVFVCSLIPIYGLTGLGLRLLVCIVFVNVFILLFYRMNSDMRRVLGLLDRVIGSKFSLIHKVLMRL